MDTQTTDVPTASSFPAAPSARPRPGRSRLAVSRRGLVAAAVLGAVAGGAVGGAAGWRASSPVLLDVVDRDVVEAAVLGHPAEFTDAERTTVITGLRESFLTLERIARRLEEPVIREVTIDGLDVVDDLRVEDIDPILAARVDLLPMQDAISGVERAFAAAAEPPTAADLRWVRAAVSDAIVRSTETRLLIQRFSDRVAVRGGSGGNRPTATAPIAVLESVLQSLDRRLDRAGDQLREASEEAWRTELRARLSLAPDSE
jgi:hypothetical protein